MNQKKIGTNVDLYNFIYEEETNQFAYMSGWNNDKDFGTLMIYNGKKNVEVAKKVYHYNMLPNGAIVYMTEYDEQSCKGTLSIYHNGKTRKIDDGVSAIIAVTH
jgi:hypothetical protein